MNAGNVLSTTFTIEIESFVYIIRCYVLVDFYLADFAKQSNVYCAGSVLFVMLHQFCKRIVVIACKFHSSVILFYKVHRLARFIDRKIGFHYA